MNRFLQQSLRGFVMACAVAFCWNCKPDSTLFKRRLASETGITFANNLTETDSLNALTFEYMYNGAGVGVGDFNKDGLPDVFFAGNQVSSRLYLNRGNLHFDDITQQANTKTSRWCTGVSVADVNEDSWPDIYVCVAGPTTDTTQRANLLFVNQGKTPDGIPRFREMSAAYGLNDMGYSTQAAFFDYDQDGDLDCYVLTNAIESTNRNALRPKRLNGEAPSTDRLYRNLRVERAKEPKNTTLPLYTNVSREAGILTEGYGLGLCLSDLNADGQLDIYCANDFLSNDLVWMPKRGSGEKPVYENRSATVLKHQTHNGMGVDIADINNDAMPDIIELDMLPEDNYRQKMMLPGSNYNRFQMDLQLGYQPQYMRNTLQLNQGNGPDGQPRFSEIGQLAGVSKTDWSWAPLLADFDNDGFKDLFIANGYRRDVTNLDFIAFNHTQGTFGTTQARNRKALEELRKLPEINVPKYAYRNKGGLTFDDVSEAWGVNIPGYSNGAAYADFDNDGDLDLITNNIDEEAFLFENQLNQQAGQTKGAKPHWLRLALNPTTGAPNLIGTKALLYANGMVQMQELAPVRGFVSTVENVLHFGLGANSGYDSLVIRYPNGQKQVLREGKVDQLMTVSYRPTGTWSPTPTTPTYFADVNQPSTGLDASHTKSTVVDFNRTPLLPHQYSMNGPGMAVGDANGDGLDDVFIGSNFGKPSNLFIQQANGTFKEQELAGSEACEVMGSLFFDADGDGDQDLYIVSGGSRVEGLSDAYQDRLFINNGKGIFTYRPGTLPAIRSSGSCVVAADYDRDGDLDLFRGGRVVPGQYPKPAESYLLRNEGGRFIDVTNQDAPNLRQVGMVTAALWTDTDNDGQTDLMVTGEWMPIMVWHNTKGKLKAVETPLSKATGWWNSLVGYDFDRDGDTDYMAGNLGLNSKLQASEQEPIRVYANDYDNNGTYDPILTFFLKHQHVPVAQRDVIVAQIPSVRKRFPTYHDYAEHTFEEMFTDSERKQALMREARQLASCYIENLGDNQFQLRPLPLEAQFSPTYGMLTGDFTGDGLQDVLLAGNSYAAETIGGWYDAGRGVLLAGDGKGGFHAMKQAGLNLDGDAKSMVSVTRPNGSVWMLIANNNGPLQVIKPTQQRGRQWPVQTDESYVVLTAANGRRMRCELYQGGGYLSQSTRHIFLPKGIEKAEFITYQGQRRTVWLGEQRSLLAKK